MEYLSYIPFRMVLYNIYCMYKPMLETSGSRMSFCSYDNTIQADCVPTVKMKKKECQQDLLYLDTSYVN